jgi:hypothetical protein
MSRGCPNRNGCRAASYVLDLHPISFAVVFACIGHQQSLQSASMDISASHLTTSPAQAMGRRMRDVSKAESCRTVLLDIYLTVRGAAVGKSATVAQDDVQFSSLLVDAAYIVQYSTAHLKTGFIPGSHMRKRRMRLACNIEVFL